MDTTKYRSIDTSKTVIDKYRYFPFIIFLTGMFALQEM